MKTKENEPAESWLRVPKHARAPIGVCKPEQVENHHNNGSSRISAAALSYYITVQWSTLHLLLLEDDMTGKKGDDTPHPTPQLQGQRINFVTWVAVEGLHPITQSSQHAGAKHLGQETLEQTGISCQDLNHATPGPVHSLQMLHHYPV